MKLLNYDPKTLIYQNLRSDVKEVQEKPQKYTQRQFNILCRLIQQKKITKKFFLFLLESLFELKDWKQLNYEQMYEMIHVLTFYDYGKGARKNG